jgi:hypothetical protein
LSSGINPLGVLLFWLACRTDHSLQSHRVISASPRGVPSFDRCGKKIQVTVLKNGHKTGESMIDSSLLIRQREERCLGNSLQASRACFSRSMPASPRIWLV